MRQKQIICILLGIAAVASGCASTQNAPPLEQVEIKEIERIPITVFTDEPALFTAAAEEFNIQNETLKLSVETAGSDAALKLRDLLLSGQSPDLVYLSRENDKGVYSALIHDEALTDLSPILEGEKKPLFYSGILDNTTVKPYGDARMTGAPIAYECAGLLYQSSSTTEPPSSFDDFLAIGKTLRPEEETPPAPDPANPVPAAAEDELPVEEEKPALFGYPQDYPTNLDPFLLPLLGPAADNIRYQTADYLKEGFSQEKTLALAQMLSSMSSYLYIGIPYSNRDAVYTAFQDNLIQYIPGDKSVYAQLQKEYGIGDTLMLAAPPAVDGNQRLLTAITPAYIPAAAAHPDESLKFLRTLYDERFFNKSSAVPPVKGSSSLLEGFDKMAAELLENGVTAYCGSFMEETENPAVVAGAYEATGQLLSGDLPPEEWGAVMADFTEQYLSNGEDIG